MDPWVAPQESDQPPVKITAIDLVIPGIVGGVVPSMLWISCSCIGLGPFAFPVTLTLALVGGVFAGRGLALKAGAWRGSLGAIVGGFTAIVQGIPSIAVLAFLPFIDSAVFPSNSKGLVFGIFAVWTLASSLIVAAVTAAGVWGSFRHRRNALAQLPAGESPPSAITGQNIAILAIGTLTTVGAIFAASFVIIIAVLTLLGNSISTKFETIERASHQPE